VLRVVAIATILIVYGYLLAVNLKSPNPVAVAPIEPRPRNLCRRLPGRCVAARQPIAARRVQFGPEYFIGAAG
jgi:hypothetical protein